MRKEKEIRTFNKKFIKFLEKNNITYSKNRHNLSIIFCFHELGDETLEIKVLDIAAIGSKILEEILIEYAEKQKELYKKGDGENGYCCKM